MSRPGPTFPKGFVASGISAGLKESGRPDMGVLAVAPEWRSKAVSAALFTTNAFAAAPVVLDRSECDLGGLTAVVVNSGNANACTGERRRRRRAGALKLRPPKRLGLRARLKWPSHPPGIIGVQLDPVRVAAGARRRL